MIDSGGFVLGASSSGCLKITVVASTPPGWTLPGATVD